MWRTRSWTPPGPFSSRSVPRPSCRAPPACPTAPGFRPRHEGTGSGSTCPPLPASAPWSSIWTSHPGRTDHDLEALPRHGRLERLLRALEGEACRDERGHVDAAGRDQPHAPFVDVLLHPPDHGDGEPLAAREGRREGGAVVAGDAAQDDPAAGAHQLHRLL